MKLTDLLAILAFLITIFVGGYAWTEYQKSVTGQQDIRKGDGKVVTQKSICPTFECMIKRTE